MRVMIRQPTRGQTLEERLAERQKIVSILEKQGHEVWGELSAYEAIPQRVNQDLWRLGRRLQDMAGTDAVYFMDGWEKESGCRLEYQAAVAFGIMAINA